MRLLPTLLLALLPALAQAAPIAPEKLPPALKSWVPWVLENVPDAACAHAHDGSQRTCDWPAELELTLTDGGASFVLAASRQSEGWLSLPGSLTHWPQDVQVDGEPAVVLQQGEGPALRLPAGRWRVTGRWVWAQAPQSLPTPPATGLVRLSRNGNSEVPPRDAGGAVWLSREAGETGGEPIKLKVFRKLEDDIPPRLTTQLLIEAAGTPREVVLGSLLPEGFTALTLQSGLPARLDEQGQLRLQTRPGVWQLELVAHGPSAPKTIQLPKLAAPWPQEEVWVWQAHPELRLVELSGASAVDPRQTQMPQDWKALPASLMTPETVLSLTEKQRGLGAPAPDALKLERDLWLDFAGSGYTLRDGLRGSFNQGWRLDSTSALVPGQVLVDGEPALITRNGKQQPGVELRNSQANLQVDARLPPGGQLPVTGYNREFGEVRTTLHLPPGYKLLAALGADSVRGDWLTAFSLLDLFLILIAIVASLRLLGIWGAVLAALTLALSWHESGAVRWAWLHLLAISALLLALPTNLQAARLGQVLRRWWFVGLLAVLLPLFVFARHQVQAALYPVLEQGSGGFAQPTVFDRADEAVMAEPVAVNSPAVEEDMVATEAAAAPAAPPAPPAPPPPPKLAPPIPSEVFGGRIAVTASKSKSGGDSYGSYSLQKLPANVLTQTGPGLPLWQWQSAVLSWQGPVDAAQQWRTCPPAPQPAATARAAPAAGAAQSGAGRRRRRRTRARAAARGRAQARAGAGGHGHPATRPSG